MGKLTDKVAKGVFWVLMEKCGLQFVHFLVTLVLARLLTPDDYGTVALLSIFITISNVFVDCGFGKALIQKKDVTQTDMNSVFFLSMAVAAVLYTGLFFAAPFVAAFYGIPELAVMLRVLALSLVFHSVNGVQNVELNRKMLFRLSFRISWAKSIASAVTGISFACAGYGAWALVWASLIGGVTGVVARQLVIRWRPTTSFSWRSAGDLFRFGWKVTVTALLDKIYSNIQALLIGKFYTRADLAFVNKGRHVPNLVSNTLTDSLRRVAFSALSKLQDDPVRLRNAMRRMIATTTFFVFPMMVVLGVLATPIVQLLFGTRWLPAVPFLQIICFSAVLRQFDTVNLQAMMARGRSDLVLKLTLARRILSLALMVCTLPLGVLPFFAINTFVVVPVGLVMNAVPNRRHLGYTFGMQFSDVAGAACLSAVTGLAVWGLSALPVGHPLALLPFQLALAPALYVGLAIAFRLDALRVIAQALLPQVEARTGAGSRLTRLLAWMVSWKERRDA